MRSDTLDRFLWELASRVPTPGGGATAGLHLAQAAALLGKAARYSDGDTATAVRNRADELRIVGIGLAEDAARAGTAPQVPAEAARVHAGVAAAAGEAIALAERLAPVAAPDVVAEVGAAADAARAAAATARRAVEGALGAITHPLVRLELEDGVEGAEELLRRADAVTAGVRARMRTDQEPAGR